MAGRCFGHFLPVMGGPGRGLPPPPPSGTIRPRRVPRARPPNGSRWGRGVPAVRRPLVCRPGGGLPIVRRPGRDLPRHGQSGAVRFTLIRRPGQGSRPGRGVPAVRRPLVRRPGGGLFCVPCAARSSAARKEASPVFVVRAEASPVVLRHEIAAENTPLDCDADSSG